MDESLCKRCGLCCSFYITAKGVQFILPTWVCKHYENCACNIYETRSCLKGREMLEKGAIPKSCAYESMTKKHREIADKLTEAIAIRYMTDEQWVELIKNFVVKK